VAPEKGDPALHCVKRGKNHLKEENQKESYPLRREGPWEKIRDVWGKRGSFDNGKGGNFRKKNYLHGEGTERGGGERRSRRAHSSYRGEGG